MSRKELIIDALGATAGAAVLFVMIWVAFALDVMTTGM